MSEGLNHEISETENSEVIFAITHLIHDCVDEFFLDEQEVLRFNSNFLESNGFEYQTNIDYMKLNRFISAAYATIQSNDFKVIDILINNLHKDIIFLNQFYKNFMEKSKDSKAIYKHIFLKQNDGLDGIEKKIFKESKKFTETEVIELDDFLKENFESIFTKNYESCKENLVTIINTKTYYFDCLLWKEARKSQSIQDFFKKSKRLETNLEEPLSTKIFIRQYLATIDLSHTKNPIWHAYLQKVLGMME